MTGHRRDGFDLHTSRRGLTASIVSRVHGFSVSRHGRLATSVNNELQRQCIVWNLKPASRAVMGIDFTHQRLPTNCSRRRLDSVTPIRRLLVGSATLRGQRAS